MKSPNIWTVALAATLTFACSDRADVDDNAIGADRTAADAGAPGADRATGATAPVARADSPGDTNAFIEKMGQVGVAEVKLGELAAERAANAEVKQFGRRMVSDHQKANNELKQVAAKANVTLPAQLDAEHQSLYDRLSKLKGAEFDREYIQAMAEGHEEVAQELERHAGAAARPGDRSVGTSGNSATGAEASVQAWASKTLPDVRQHLEQARQIQSKLTAQKPR
jgi:putative membrane protein